MGNGKFADDLRGLVGNAPVLERYHRTVTNTLIALRVWLSPLHLTVRYKFRESRIVICRIS
jgi:hypothetical protein